MDQRHEQTRDWIYPIQRMKFKAHVSTLCSPHGAALWRYTLWLHWRSSPRLCVCLKLRLLPTLPTKVPDPPSPSSAWPGRALTVWHNGDSRTREHHFILSSPVYQDWLVKRLFVDHEMLHASANLEARGGSPTWMDRDWNEKAGTALCQQWFIPFGMVTIDPFPLRS